MSAPMDHGCDSRFDSATSLNLCINSSPARNNRRNSHVTEISAVAYPPPWSRLNTRVVGRSQTPTYSPSDWWPSAHASSEPGPSSYHARVLEDGLATTESTLDPSMSDTSTPASYCHSPSSPLPLRWAAAPNANTTSLPSTLDSSHYRSPSPPLPSPWAAASNATTKGFALTLYTNNTTIRCGQCGVDFTGTYRRGNLARHVRQKHTEAQRGPYTCTASGCYRVFARQDARLKHGRQHHPGLYPEPVQRGQGHGRDSTTSDSNKNTVGASNHDVPTQNRDNYDPCPQVSKPRNNDTISTTSSPTNSTMTSSLDFTVGQIFTSPSSADCTRSVSDTQARFHEADYSLEIEELPQKARLAFLDLRTKVNDEEYTRLCDGTFRRWEGFVEQLRIRRSDTYAVFAKALEDLYRVIQAIDSGAIDSSDPNSNTSGPSRARPDHNQEAGSQQASSDLGFDTNVNVTSLVGRGPKSGRSRLSQVGGVTNRLKAVRGKGSKMVKTREVDCPIHKHLVMHAIHVTALPCNGCREKVMSQVRAHVNRVPHPGFHRVQQCPRCKKDFLNEQEYDSHVNAYQCQHQPQPRGDIITPWVKLYLTYFPRAIQVPSPFCDDNGWLSNSLVAQCRSSSSNSTTFLGRSQGPMSPTPADGPSYDGAVDFMLQDLIAPRHARNRDAQVATYARSFSTTNSPNHGAASRPTEDRFREALQRISSRYYRALAAAPRFLTPGELHSMANEAEALVHSIRILLQQEEQLQQPHIQHPRYSDQARPHPDVPRINTNYATPVRSHPSPATSNKYYGTQGMSTQSSSQGFTPASSQYLLSPQTDPSSLSDPSLLSPFQTPSYHRRTSLPAQHAQTPIWYQHGPPSGISLPDAYTYGGSPSDAADTPVSIDPRLTQWYEDHLEMFDNDLSPSPWAGSS